MSKRLKYLLFLQIVLVIIGLVTQVGLFVFSLTNNLMPIMTVSYGVLVAAHIGAILYGIIGYKKGQPRYFILIALFLIAILLNIILPFRDVTQKVLLTILFGLMSVFMFKQEDSKFTNYLILIAAIVALGFSVYSSITANPNALGDVTYKTLSTIFMYLSIFAPVMFVGLFGVSYNVKLQNKR